MPWRRDDVMTETTKQTTIGEIAASKPGATRLFERMGIDYCCGGALSLAEASRRAGVPVNDVARLLDECVGDGDSGPTEWTLRPSAELVGHILATHHGFTRSECARMLRLSEKVAARHGEAHPLLHELHAVVQRMADGLATHMLKEERVLFPMVLRGLDHATASFVLSGPVRVMRADHDEVGEQLAAIRRLTTALPVPSDACMSWRALYESLGDLEADLHRHMHLENNVLFGRIQALAAGG